VASSDQAANDVTLIDIPTDSQYRATLRIYGFTSAPMNVSVAILPENGDTAFARFDVELNGIVTIEYVPFPPNPAYRALDPLIPAARAAGGRVRIEITNHGDILSPPPPKIWAFVSLTNNVTNQVTIVTPR
jgi:hypothetical protein